MVADFPISSRHYSKIPRISQVGCSAGCREDGESETVFIERVVEEALATGFVEGVVGGSYESGVADVCFPITGKLNECREKMEDWGEFGP